MKCTAGRCWTDAAAWRNTPGETGGTGKTTDWLTTSSAGAALQDRRRIACLWRVCRRQQSWREVQVGNHEGWSALSGSLSWRRGGLLWSPALDWTRGTVSAQQQHNNQPGSAASRHRLPPASEPPAGTGPISGHSHSVPGIHGCDLILHLANPWLLVFRSHHRLRNLCVTRHYHFLTDRTPSIFLSQWRKKRRRTAPGQTPRPSTTFTWAPPLSTCSSSSSTSSCGRAHSSPMPLSRPRPLSASTCSRSPAAPSMTRPPRLSAALARTSPRRA